MFEPLLEALPGFRPARQAFPMNGRGNHDNLGAEPGILPDYLLLAGLTRHLATLLEAEELKELKRALAVIDRWLMKGDIYVREAAIVGLIKGLQNVAQRQTIAEE